MSGLLPGHCVTCSDEAVEAVVARVEGATAVVVAGGSEECVAIDLVPGVVTGDVLLCHAGIALEIVQPRRPAEAGHHAR